MLRHFRTWHGRTNVAARRDIRDSSQHRIARNAPLALAGIKATIQRAISLRGSITHADLDEASGRARQSADASEGRRAMLEKRRPVFRGE